VTGRALGMPAFLSSRGRSSGTTAPTACHPEAALWARPRLPSVIPRSVFGHDRAFRLSSRGRSSAEGSACTLTQATRGRRKADPSLVLRSAAARALGMTGESGHHPARPRLPSVIPMPVFGHDRAFRQSSRGRSSGTTVPSVSHPEAGLRARPRLPSVIPRPLFGHDRAFRLSSRGRPLAEGSA
jgi:hypothetical protein